MAVLEPEGELVVSSLAQVHDLLWAIRQGEHIAYPASITFGGELATIDLKFEGPGFHRSLPGAFARGLWGFQEEIYRAVAVALYGTDDLRRLSKEDLQNFNLVFQVEDGSTGFEAAINNFMSELGKGLSDMDDSYKLAAILGVAVVLATGSAVGRIGRSHFDAKTRKVEIDGQVQIEEVRSAAETKRLAEIAGIIDAAVGRQNVVEAFKKATAEGAKQAIKAAPDATSATYGFTSFDQDAIKEITARSARESTDRVTVTDSFLVTGHRRPPGADVARFSLSNRDGEMSAIVDLSDAGPLTEEQRARFWEAVQGQKMVHLQVTVSSKGGVVKQAVIEDMPDPDPSVSDDAKQ